MGSKGLSNEKFTSANVTVCPKLIWMNKIRLKFKRSCLKQEDETSYALKNVIDLLLSMN